MSVAREMLDTFGMDAELAYEGKWVGDKLLESVTCAQATS